MREIKKPLTRDGRGVNGKNVICLMNDNYIIVKKSLQSLELDSMLGGLNE